ncbi:hypothetical protein IRJ41_010641, partial [Triplophysa rosa]
LHRCGITNQGCAALALALKSNTSHLRELGLSHNVLGDSGVSQLCAGLENTNCILEILSLRECCITDESCAALGSALKFNPSHLTELDLSGNRIAMPGKNLLDELKDSPDYKLDRVIGGSTLNYTLGDIQITGHCGQSAPFDFSEIFYSSLWTTSDLLSVRSEFLRFEF